MPEIQKATEQTTLNVKQLTISHKFSKPAEENNCV